MKMGMYDDEEMEGCYWEEGKTGAKIMKLIYTAFAKEDMWRRARISKYVLEQGHIPINPFMLMDYNLMDSITAEQMREMNNDLVTHCDELWIFSWADGVEREIDIAEEYHITIVDKRGLKL